MKVTITMQHKGSYCSGSIEYMERERLRRIYFLKVVIREKKVFDKKVKHPEMEKYTSVQTTLV